MLITNAIVITWDKTNQIMEGNAVYISGGRIVEIGKQKELIEKYPFEKQVDAHSQLLMPGNICAHTHFYGAYSRGLYVPGSAARDFPEILNKLWWPLDRALDEKSIYYSAMVSLIDAVKHGTTLVFDHHASPRVINGSLDIIAQAVRQVGVRGSLCYEVTDRNGKEGAAAGINENLRFIELCKRKPYERLSATFGLHASLTLSEETLINCKETGNMSGFHVHVAEHSIDEYDSISKSGKRVVDRLKNHGLLGPHSIIVHAVHVDAEEIRLLAESGSRVTHQPRSNMNNAVGLPRVEEMMRAGIPVCLGNDGFSNAMWEEWKTAYLAHKLINLDPRRMNGNDIVQMAVYNNADLANHHFTGGPYGVVKEGAVADLILVDYHPYTPLTIDNLPWHILFGFHESMVTMTMVAGEILMQDRVLVTVDEEEIFQKALSYAPEVWRKYWSQFEN